MNLVLDERSKHRLVGLAVLLSIAAIFLPAMMKKSNRHFDDLSLSMQIPQKPTYPKVEVATAKALFKTTKVAHVELPPLDDQINEVLDTIQIVKAESLSAQRTLEKGTTSFIASVRFPTLEKFSFIYSSIPAILPSWNRFHVNKAPVVAVRKKSSYAVQLASFAQQRNAERLVAQLRDKGYKANYSQTAKSGGFYKVLVGQLDEKSQAIDLQKQLGIVMQLNGFIVSTGVS